MPLSLTLPITHPSNKPAHSLLSSMATAFLFFFSIIINVAVMTRGASNWCVARSDASNRALQTALDYACSAGADCSPLLSNGLCFLPNTIQAHASYAFNSYFQRKAMAPGSCDFSGTATIARTDPSYGSCVYPSSSSTAGGAITGQTPTTTNSPPTPLTTTPLSGGFNPGKAPPLPPDYSIASFRSSPPLFVTLLPISLSLLLCIIL